jgi:hypothetical protein
MECVLGSSVQKYCIIQFYRTMKTHIIQLERHDDAISTRDKMMWGSSSRILLVFPEKGSILTRRVDLVLLQRHSTALGAQLALVTTSAIVRQNARDLGIMVFKSVIQAQKSPWRVPLAVRRKFMRRPPQRLALDELRQRLVRPVSRVSVGQRLVVFSIGFAAVLALAFFFLPNASLQLVMAEQEQRLALQIWANPSILAPNLSGGIPAEITKIILEGTETANSTGRIILPNQAATGEVLFVNLTNRDVLVPAGTIVRTQNDPPVRFETQLSLVVKADSGEEGARSPVRAVLSGSGGNVQTGEIVAIEGEVGPLLAVSNPEFTSGGTNQTSPSPNQQDFERARQSLLQRLSQQAEEEMQASTPTGAYLLLPSLQMQAVEFEDRQPEEGQPGDRFKLTMRVAFTAWYITAENIQQAATTALDANMDPGFTPVADTIKIKLMGKPVLRGNGMGYEIEAVRQLKANWSKEEVVRLIRGKDLITAAGLVEDKLLLKSAPHFQMSPHWWPRLPYLPFRIQVGAQ